MERADEGGADGPLRRLTFTWWRYRRIPPCRRRAAPIQPRSEILEPRELPAAIVMESATTVDSKSVTIDYRVLSPVDAQHPLTFGVDRSADGAYSAADIAVGSQQVVGPAEAPTLDDHGQPAGAVGEHQLTIALPGGLVINPQHPYVVVAANPGSTPAGQAPPTASFRTASIAVITHGGIEDPSWKYGPPWELVMADTLKAQGYDAVIPFNWVSSSSTPGAAVKQVPRLVQRVLDAAAQFAPGEPVNVHFIGDSEGASINTQAIVHLASSETPDLRAGFLEDTLLDPHAANNAVPTPQASYNGVLGALAKSIITTYQSSAHDPPVYIPANVDLAEVFYQHTPASKDHGTNDGIYNLWGQVPVPGKADYFNLTAAGATHSGKTGIMWWYQYNIVPMLGNGEPGLLAQVLTGSLQTAATASQPADTIDTAQALYAGTAGPGSVVRLYVGPAADPASIHVVGRTVAGADGSWSITTPALANGRYRVVAVATPPTRHTLPRFIVNPTTPLGRLTVDAPRRAAPGASGR